MSELLCLELAIALWFAHVVVQGALSAHALDAPWLAGNRDDPREPKGLAYPRATRAIRNYIENLVPFAATDLALIVTHKTGGWGATVWIVMRILYLPTYVLGLSPARSIVWTISVLGLLMMLVQLVF